MVSLTRKIFFGLIIMPTFQNELESIRIVQIDVLAIFILTFQGGAIRAYVCDPASFSLDQGINPNDVRELLRDNQISEA